MPKKVKTEKKPPRATLASDLAALRGVIENHVQTAIAESWKGGGDPTEVPVLEAQLEYSTQNLNAHLERIERDHG